ncbi:hypothetical protein [Nodularia sphaerocarpa]|uniref:hypothetical protein n=1 Tax=Nodularia sphaerocarpa TaxID=137816 RepID=UPI001EFB4670|nr:hypothetical protein [Nodularia sphaerocarpa]MDB9374062.1 hypothetical protein [Nodularia sphaerocarpa CS-585]ULP71451.1 hypothetical protein BDGGKGIB_01077 [Nodularia sphaerocarpa UHCC 0038]
MTDEDKKILKEIVEIQQSLLSQMIDQLNISLDDQEHFYKSINERIDELLEKLE